LGSEHAVNTRTLRLVIAAGAALLAGCSGGSMSGYDWSLYDHVKLATPEALETHVTVLQEIVADADEKDAPPRPGACAELGYWLVVVGETERGLALLDREAILYPESVKFVLVLKRLATGEREILADPPPKQDGPRKGDDSPSNEDPPSKGERP
jgi:hypothetical protein